MKEKQIIENLTAALKERGYISYNKFNEIVGKNISPSLWSKIGEIGFDNGKEFTTLKTVDNCHWR